MTFKRCFKNLISCALILALSLTPAFVFASVNVYYETVAEEYISGGIVHKTYDILTSNGWLEVNVVQADMSNENLHFEPIYSSSGVGTLATVKTQMSDNSSAVAAVNADFFSWGSYSGTGSPIGGVIKEGELVSSGANTTNMQALVQFEDSLLGLQFLNPTINLVHNGNEVQIGGMNKYADVENPHIYTSAWGNQYVNEFTDVYCIVVENDRIKEIFEGQKYTDIPKNGFVVACVKRNFALLDYLKIGDKLTYKVSNVTDAINAIGGGTLLLKNGQFAEITHNVSGRHPRTAVGISKDQKTLYLVTVDGRQGHSVGATLPEMAEVMLHIGAWSALNLDGGGSTSMVVRDLDWKVQQANSPSENRKVANSAAIIMGNKKGKLERIVVMPKQNSYFVGETIAADVIGFDEYGNLVNLDKNKLTLENLKTTKIGKQTVTATYEKIKATADVSVFQPINIEKDEKNIDKAENAEYTVNIIGNMNQYKTLGDKLLTRKFVEEVSGNMINIVASKYAPDGLKNVVMDTSESKTWAKDDNLFISLNTANAKIGAQWTWLKSTVANVKENKVFLILNHSIDDVNEWSALLDTLEQQLVLKGKEVYIIMQADKLKNTSRNGIRIITTSNATQGLGANGILQAYGEMKYVQLQFAKDGKVSWTLKGM